MWTVETLALQSKHDFDALSAARICDAYELFVELRPSAQRSSFTFEHAWFLVRALKQGTEISAAQCSRCAGLTLRDIYAPRLTVCPFCETLLLKTTRSRRCRRNHATETEV
jgi:hypothetical protein